MEIIRALDSIDLVLWDHELGKLSSEKAYTRIKEVMRQLDT